MAKAYILLAPRLCALALVAASLWIGPARAQTLPDFSASQSVTEARATFGATSRFTTRYEKDSALADGTQFSLGVGRFCTSLVSAQDDGVLSDIAPVFGLNVRCAGTFGTLAAPGGSRLVDAATDRVAVASFITQAARRRLSATGGEVIYFVRDLNFRLDPADAAVLGAPSAVFGVGVRLRLVGAASGALTVTASDLFGRAEEGGALPLGATQNGRQQIAIVGGANLETGRVYAEFETSGLGPLRATWEVREPGRAALSEADRRALSELSAQERRGLAPLRVVNRANGARYRVTGRVRRIGQKLLIEGPRYAELPRSVPGRYELILRIDDLYDVATAAPLDVLPYIVQPDASAVGDLKPRLTQGPDGAAVLTWRRPPFRSDLRLLWTATSAGGAGLCEGVAAIGLGRIDLPRRCASSGASVSVRPMAPSGEPVGARVIAVR